MTSHLITQEQLDQLRQIAENATPGPWIQKGVTVLGPREPWDLGTGPARIIAAQMPWMRERMEANAAHAAAFDPITVLALIDQVQGMRAALVAIQELHPIEETGVEGHGVKEVWCPTCQDYAPCKTRRLADETLTSNA